MSCRVCVESSLNLAEVICNNLFPLCNRETLVYGLRNVPVLLRRLSRCPTCLKVWTELTSALIGLEIFAGSSYVGSVWPTGAKIGSSYRQFREIGDEIIELEWSKSKGNKDWLKISGGSGKRGFEKSGFHCTVHFYRGLAMIFLQDSFLSVRNLLIAEKTWYSGFFLLSFVTRFACDICHL